MQVNGGMMKKYCHVPTMESLTLSPVHPDHAAHVIKRSDGVYIVALCSCGALYVRQNDNDVWKLAYNFEKGR